MTLENYQALSVVLALLSAVFLGALFVLWSWTMTYQEKLYDKEERIRNADSDNSRLHNRLAELSNKYNKLQRQLKPYRGVILQINRLLQQQLKTDEDLLKLYHAEQKFEESKDSDDEDDEDD